jgi:hypothetical protein
MPIPSLDTVSDSALRDAALAELRKGVNPFSTAVASVGTAAESVQTDVRAHTKQQLAVLLKIVELYRGVSAATRIYPVVGDPGTGKTHLLYVLRSELRQQALRDGKETLFVVVEHRSTGTDPIDYLLWQITNHMLTNTGDGLRMLNVIAGRLTGQLLAESLRRLSSPQQIELIPPAGFWQGMRMRFGSAQLAQERVDAVAKLIEIVDAGPEPAALREACHTAGIAPERALKCVTDHLEQSQSKSATDWFRKELYSRIARFVLLDDRKSFDDFHNGEAEPPASMKGVGNVGRCLLVTWLELLEILRIPVVVVYDQLEDFLRAATPEQERINQKDFIKAVTSYVDNVRGVCVITFAAYQVWVDLTNAADPYSQQRLAQLFSLAGQPARTRIEMPDRVSCEVAEQIVATRIRQEFPALNLTGLPPTFPFSKPELVEIVRDRNLRGCLLELAKRYDQIVYPAPVQDGARLPLPNSSVGALVPSGNVTKLARRLEGLWRDQNAAAKASHGAQIPTTMTYVPTLQTALEGWLQHLRNAGIPGAASWANVEVVTKPERRQCGYLTVIRFEQNKPGIGIAVWLGYQGIHQLNNLRHVLGYFNDNPCPIRALLLLRADGTAALTGMSGELYAQTRERDGRDVRVVPYDVGFFHSLMGFAGWYSAALAEVEAAGREGVDAAPVLRDFLAEVSKPLIAWVDQWREPAAAKGA